MKKLTLLAAIAACGMSVANAQYVSYETSVTATTEVGQVYHAFGMNTAVQEALVAEGKEVFNYNVDDTNIFMYVWSGLEAWDTYEPGVDDNYDGYTAFVVSPTDGWSGCGQYISTEADFSALSDDSHFHMCLRSGTVPSSLGIIIGQADDGYGWNAATISVGSTAFENDGTIYPLVGALDTEGDWIAIDITFAQLKELCPDFEYTAGAFVGNVYAILAGSVAGVNFAIDGVYFYSPASEGSSVSNIAVNNDDIEVIVSDKTIQVLGNNNAGIQLYNISGQLVKSGKTAVVGCEDLASGVYVVKAGNVVKKVVLK